MQSIHDLEVLHGFVALNGDGVNGTSNNRLCPHSQWMSGVPIPVRSGPAIVNSR